MMNTTNEKEMDTTNNCTTSTTLTVSNSTSASAATTDISTMRDKHSVVKSQLEKAKAELIEKQKLLQSVEDKKYSLEGRLCIAEQNIRSINEKLFTIQTGVNEKEKVHEELLKEFVEVEWKNKLCKDKLLKYENTYLDFQVEKAIRIDEVEKEEAMGTAEARGFDEKEGIDEDEETRLFRQIQQDVDKYQTYKDRLANGDMELTRIVSGEALEELEMRKNGIRDAFARREARAEGIYMEIDEKNDVVANLKVSMQIKEKQNQARLRKLSRELQDKEATVNHLQQTVEYLDLQIDPCIVPSKFSNNKNNKNIFPIK